MMDQHTLNDLWPSLFNSVLNGDNERVYDLELANSITNGKKHVSVDFNDVYTHNPELANDLILSPQDHLPIIEQFFNDKTIHRDEAYLKYIGGFKVRLSNLPETAPLRDLGSVYLGKLIQVRGIVVKTSSVKPYVIKTHFLCEACGETLVLVQVEETLMTPRECAACNSRRGFQLKYKECVFTDHQVLRIQEQPEELPPGQMPRQVRVILTGDLVNTVRPGDRITLVGWLNLLKEFVRGGIARTFNLQLKANSVIVQGQDLVLLELTDEDVKQIQEFSKDPFLERKMIQSVAPSIKGHENIKKALLLQQFGGVPKIIGENRIRGDINILLCGDPGTAKSQLLTYQAKIAPRAIETAGRGASGVGLTAATIKEQGGGYSLEAGAMVLADMGVCCIDEFDKMRDEDREAIHPAMEQQVVHIAKGGIIADLNSRTAVLAAANPKHGRYNPYETPSANLNLSVTLLSRFDLIFLLRDIPNPERDKAITKHIFDVHYRSHSVEPPIKSSLLRKYISYAKSITPTMTPEAEKAITEFNLKMRRAFDESQNQTISITWRQLESLIRLSEARAKLHLRKEILKEDADAVIALMVEVLTSVSLDPYTGEIDVDIIYTGKPKSLQKNLEYTLNAIVELEQSLGVVKDEDLFEQLERQCNFSKTESQRFTSILMRDGTIYSPRPNYYKRTS